MIKGIQYLVDGKGTATAVLIDLKEYQDLWEDFYDSVTAHGRADEPRESLQSVKKRLKKQGKLRG